MDVEREREILLKRDADWSEAAYEGKDIERILSYWTDDAVVMPPHLATVSGKDALRSYVESSFQIPGFKIRWQSDDVEFSPDGNFAYVFSENEVTMDDTGGRPGTTAGRALTIWRRDANGDWRCSVDIWNSAT